MSLWRVQSRDCTLPLLGMGEDNLVAEISPQGWETSGRCLQNCCSFTVSVNLSTNLPAGVSFFLLQLYHMEVWPFLSQTHKAARSHCHTQSPGSMDLTLSPPPQDLRPTKKQSGTQKITLSGWQDTPENRGICADHTSLLSSENHRPLYFSWTSTYSDQTQLHPSRELCFRSLLDSSLPRKGTEQCQQPRCTSGCLLAPSSLLLVGLRQWRHGTWCGKPDCFPMSSGCFRTV